MKTWSQLTEKRFQRAVDEMKKRGSKITDVTIEYAHHVLVEGSSVKNVADANNVSTRLIQRACKTISTAYNEYVKELPEDWVMLRIPVPIQDVKTLEDKYSELLIQKQASE